MKQFLTILKFEFFNYVRNKVFIALTLLFIAAVGIALFWPRLMTADPTSSAGRQTIAVQGGDAAIVAAFEAAFEGYDIIATATNPMDGVSDGEYAFAVAITGPLQYDYIVKDIGLFDTNQAVIDSVMTGLYQVNALNALGADAAQTADILGAAPVANVVQAAGGRDQTNSFFYTYILLFALYMAIMLYGQLVSMSVATEKSSRAMELLITSAKPTRFMFGKIIGTGGAGLLQFILVFGSAFAFYQMNKALYVDNMVIQAIFGMPLWMLGWALVFFVLGFFIFAFLYGALGSVISRIEQLNTATLPVTFLSIAAFMLVMFSMTAGNVDSGLMKFASFFPLTSPMAMFARMSMSSVPAWEVAVSVGLLVVSTIGVGMLAAGIYRMGVLMYGQPPKINQLIQLLRQRDKG